MVLGRSTRSSHWNRSSSLPGFYCSSLGLFCCSTTGWLCWSSAGWFCGLSTFCFSLSNWFCRWSLLRCWVSAVAGWRKMASILLEISDISHEDRNSSMLAKQAAWFLGVLAGLDPKADKKPRSPPMLSIMQPPGRKCYRSLRQTVNNWINCHIGDR